MKNSIIKKITLKLILTFIQEKISAKRFLHIGFVSVAIIGVALANAAKEDSKVAAANQPEKSHHEAHEDQDHHEKSALLTDEQLKAAAIGLAQVGPADIRESISLYGTVEANGERTQHISARFPGLIKSVNKKLGDAVRQGEVLATIEGNESLRTYSITAAFNGVIAERNANTGEHTNDKPLFVVVDLSSVWVDVAVFPRDAGKIRIGQTVRVIHPSNEFAADGEIISVSALGSSANQALNARVLLNNAEREWTPGIFVNADVVLAKKSVALAIRNEALQDHEGKQVVFVRGKTGFEPRPVKLGRADGVVSEVLSGLKAGEIYATNNSFIIKAELGKDGVEHDD